MGDWGPWPPSIIRPSPNTLGKGFNKVSTVIIPHILLCGLSDNASCTTYCMFSMDIMGPLSGGTATTLPTGKQAN